MSAPTAKLSFEIAQLRRLKFGKKSEQLDAEQRALFDEALDADLAAAEAQLQELLGKKKPPAKPGAMPKRTALPADLPRVGLPPRAREHPLRVRLCAQAHQREAGLHAGRVHGRVPHPQQVDLRIGAER
jgi:outer membrane protein TolC